MFHNGDTMNDSPVTIVFDRDKVSLESIKPELDQSYQFHCSRHRSDNIAGIYGSSAFRAYNNAVAARSIPELNKAKSEQINRLQTKAHEYMSRVHDWLQFSIERTSLWGKLYGRSSNGFSEAMHSANSGARVRGLDMFNAFVKPILLEQFCFRNMQMYAKDSSHPLSEKAKLLLETNQHLVEFCKVEWHSGRKASVVCLMTMISFHVELGFNWVVVHVDIRNSTIWDASTSRALVRQSD